MEADGAARQERLLRALAACGMAGPLAFTPAWLVLGALQPGYDPATQFISKLAAVGAPYTPPMVTAFLLLGGPTLAFSCGLHRGIGGGAGSPLGPLLGRSPCPCTPGAPMKMTKTAVLSRYPMLCNSVMPMGRHVARSAMVNCALSAAAMPRS